MEKSTMLLMGKTNYFYGHVQVRKLLVITIIHHPSIGLISRVKSPDVQFPKAKSTISS